MIGKLGLLDRGMGLLLIMGAEQERRLPLGSLAFGDLFHCPCRDCDNGPGRNKGWLWVSFLLGVFCEEQKET